jgi:hypothetical protein
MKSRDGSVSCNDGEHEGAQVVLGGHVQIGPAPDERLDHLTVPMVRRQHRGGLPVAISGSMWLAPPSDPPRERLQFLG